jgi:hypothetical protein
MGLTKPQVKDYAPLICRMERKMAAASLHLSYVGRLQLVNSVLSSLPAYYMCTLKLPITVIDIIDKHRKNCLWRGREFNRKGYNLVAWDLVRKPKAKGGLGVINLSVQNDALLLKQLDKFYKQEKIQWISLIWQKYDNGTVPHLAREKGSFWWKDILRLNVHFRGVAMCIPNHGNTISFWEDLISGKVHSDIFPHLLGFVKDPRIFLWALRQSASLLNCFRIPMSRGAYNDLLQLQNFLDDLYPVDQDGKDSWIYIWGQHRYSSSKYYDYHFIDIQPNLTILWIWKSKCIPKIKFFAWLLLNDRFNSRNILRRRRKFL